MYGFGGLIMSLICAPVTPGFPPSLILEIKAHEKSPTILKICSHPMTHYFEILPPLNIKYLIILTREKSGSQHKIQLWNGLPS